MYMHFTHILYAFRSCLQFIFGFRSQSSKLKPSYICDHLAINCAYHAKWPGSYYVEQKCEGYNHII